MTKKLVTYIDPAEGWKYGFPKALPEYWEQLSADERALWFEQQGYPLDLLQYPCRYFQMEEEL